MIPRSIRLLPPLVFAAMMFSRLAGAAAAEPVQTLQTATDQVLAIIYEKPADGRLLADRARPVMEKYFNFASLTRRSVGPGWRQFSPAQQQRTTQLLTELVIRNYCAHFDTAVRSRVTYGTPMVLAPDRCELPTTIIYNDKNIAVSYRAEQLPEGWRFYDVIVEGVSLVANYRAQFTELFQKGGADAIISALEKNLAENPPV